MDNLINQRLDGRYYIEQLLGAGGMANVYKGVDLQANRPIAVKVLKAEFTNNADLVRRFKNEAKAISLLSHPNITKVYDVSVSDELQYIVMEYIEGITLKEYMEYRARPLTYKETLHFIMQILAALQHAHDKGIVHRDVKPQNIMLLADGTIKVMDFGIARFSRSESHTITDKAIGSVHYISPEQARGNATDVRADIYSVGVMMYEMLSGHLPFESDSPVSVAIKQISEEARPLRELNPAVPEALAAITARAMAKEPRERYPSAREMMADLEEFKRNPNGVRPAYRAQPVQESPQDEEPTRFIEKVETDTGRKTASGKPGVRPSAKRGTGAAARSASRKPAGQARGKRSIALPILAGVAAAFAIGAAILIFVIFKTTSSDLFTKHENVELPNFVDMKVEDVTENSQYSNFKFETEEQYDADAEAGTIINQSPKPPKTVKDNATIKLYVSKGAQMVKLPNLIGKTRQEAIKELSANGILFRIVSEATNETTPGKVLRMEPEAGTQVRAGNSEDMVTIVLSKEEVPEVSVPSLVGKLLDDAKKQLQNDQEGALSIGTVTKQDDTAPEGTILSQEPMAGESVRKGSSIQVVVSTGAVPTAREVTVIFDATVDEADWTLTFEGGATQTFHTTAGQATTWTVSYTDTGVKAVLLTSTTGVSQMGSVNYGPDGGTQTFHTTAGQATTWTVSYTDTGVKAVLLTSTTGVSQMGSVNYGPDGGNTTFTVGGSTQPTPPAGSDPTPPAPPASDSTAPTPETTG